MEGDEPFGKLYLRDIYNLSGFHFHSPSEHEIDSMRYYPDFYFVHFVNQRTRTLLDECRFNSEGIQGLFDDAIIQT